MGKENFEQAKQYALHRLERDLPEGLYYHGLNHTRNDIVPAADSLAQQEGVRGEERVLLLTAAWFHDLGFTETRRGHEAVGAQLAREALPGFGYDPSQIETIQRIIMATVIPQSPTTLLEEIMADADLDNLGRDDFLMHNGNLRRELEFFGEKQSDLEWFTAQLKFIEGHTYFTASAHRLRDAGQLKNIEGLKKILAGMK